MVKNAFLKAYELVPEAYRQLFRGLSKSDKQTYVEFAKEKETLTILPKVFAHLPLHAYEFK